MVESIEKLDAGEAILGIRARDRQRPSLLRATRPVDRVELPIQLIERNISPDSHAEPRFDAAERQNAIDFRIDHRTWRPIARDAEAHHAAEPFMLLEKD